MSVPWAMHILQDGGAKCADSEARLGLVPAPTVMRGDLGPSQILSPPWFLTL